MPKSIQCRCGHLSSNEERATLGVCPACGENLQEPLTGALVAGLPDASAGRWQESSLEEERQEVGTFPSGHGGAPVPEADDIFAEAPPEIGEVLSVSSTLNPMAEGTRYLLRLLTVAAVAGITAFGLLLSYEFARVWNLRPLDSTLGLLITMSPIFAGATLFTFAVNRTAFKHECNFVGIRGFARVTCTGHRGNITQTQVVLFDNVYALFVRVGDSYIKNTDRLHFEFLDSEHRFLHRISVWYHPWAEENRAHHPCQFPLAIERAWSHYLMEHRADRQENDGSWLFSIRGKGFVQLTDTGITIRTEGTIRELGKNQIARVRFEPARFIWLEAPDAKRGFFGNTGIHELWYGDLENAQFFLALLTRVWGIPLTRPPASRFLPR